MGLVLSNGPNGPKVIEKCFSESNGPDSKTYVIICK